MHLGFCHPETIGAANFFTPLDAEYSSNEVLHYSYTLDQSKEAVVCNKAFFLLSLIGRSVQEIREACVPGLGQCWKDDFTPHAER